MRSSRICVPLKSRAQMDAIEAENPSLKGVLPKVFARQNLDPTSLGGLMDLVGNIALGDAKARSADVVVWKKLDGTHQVTSWKWLGDAAAPSPATGPQAGFAKSEFIYDTAPFPRFNGCVPVKLKSPFNEIGLFAVTAHRMSREQALSHRSESKPEQASRHLTHGK